jgi:hypothetical protein
MRINACTTHLLFLALVLGLGTFFILPAYGFPNVINLQGKLTDAQFNAQRGTHNFSFYVYSNLTGGNLRYTENTSITTVQGVWSHELGSITPLNLRFDEDYYIQIKVDGQILQPRIRMGAVGYAYRANYTEFADNLSENAHAVGNLTVGNTLSAPVITAASVLQLLQGGTLLFPQGIITSAMIASLDAANLTNLNALYYRIVLSAANITSGMFGGNFVFNGTVNFTGNVVLNKTICQAGEVLSTEADGTLRCTADLTGAAGTGSNFNMPWLYNVSTQGYFNGSYANWSNDQRYYQIANGIRIPQANITTGIGNIPAENITNGTFGGTFGFTGTVNLSGDVIVDKTKCAEGYVLSTTTNGMLICVNDTTVGAYTGQTASSYTGSITNGTKSGYDAANAICDSNFPGSHMCAISEIMHTIALGSFSGISGDAWVANGPPGYTANANDCKGWTSAAANYLGSFWNWGDTNGGGAGYLTACTGSKKINCCG